MKFKHLGISALALGLVIGGGASLSAFASADSEETPKETMPILKSNADKLSEGTIYMDEVQGEANAGTEYYEFNGTDEMPEGAIYKDEVQGDTNTNTGTEYYELNGTAELPEGVNRMNEVKMGEASSGTGYYEFNGTDELPERTIYKDEVKSNQE